MSRDPAVAGQFYPGTKAGLRKEIEKYIIKKKDLNKEKLVDYLVSKI